MILKIRYRPISQSACWVYIGNIKKLELSTISVIPKCSNFNAYYINKEKCTKKTHCECELCNERRGFKVISVTLNNGQIESYVIDRDAFLLNDNGGTVEKLNL